MIDISIIVPTRERVGHLRALIASLERTTASLSHVELLLIRDNDDAETAEFASDTLPSWIRWLLWHGRSVDMPTYFMAGCAITSGRYIFVMNDDTEFDTPNWDDILVKTLDSLRKPDGIVYGHVDSRLGATPAPWSDFPILSREAIDVLGYVLHPQLAAYGTDIHLFNLYAAVDRVFYVPIRIRHHLGLMDATKLRQMERSKDYVLPPLDADIAKLRARIEACRES